MLEMEGKFDRWNDHRSGAPSSSQSAEGELADKEADNFGGDGIAPIV